MQLFILPDRSFYQTAVITVKAGRAPSDTSTQTKAHTDRVCGNKHQTSAPNKRIAAAGLNAFKTIFKFWSQTEKLGIVSVLSQTGS